MVGGWARIAGAEERAKRVCEMRKSEDERGEKEKRAARGGPGRAEKWLRDTEERGVMGKKGKRGKNEERTTCLGRKERENDEERKEPVRVEN